MPESAPATPNHGGNNFDQYLPPPDLTQYRVDVPSQSGPSYPAADLPTPMDPMGIIEARGEVYRNLQASHAPMWTVMTSWFLIGLPGFFLVGMSLSFGLPYLKEMVISSSAKDWSTLWDNGLILLFSILMFGLGTLFLLIPARSTLNKLKRLQTKR